MISIKTERLTRKQWVKKLDRLWSQVIFARDKRCVRCYSPKKLGAAHLYPKGLYSRLRWDTDNGLLLCWFRCHLNFAHRDPLGFKDWLDATIDPKRLARLKLRSQVIDRSPWDYQAVEIYLKQELKKYVD